MLICTLALSACPAVGEEAGEAEGSEDATSSASTETTASGTESGTETDTGTEASTDTEGQGSAFDAAVEALGGAEALLELSALQFDASGTRWFTYEGLTPEQRVELSTYTGSFVHELESDALRVDMERQAQFEATQFLPPTSLALILDGELGALTIPANMSMTGALGSQVVGAQWAQHRLMNPHLVVIEALEDPSTVSADEQPVELEGAPHTAVSIASELGQLRLLVDDASGRISGLETTHNHLLTRDAALELRYADWQEIEGLMFPAVVELRVDGQLTHAQSRSGFTTMPALASDTFELPPEVDESSADAELLDWGRTSHPVVDQFFQLGMAYPETQAITPVELAPGVTWFDAGPTSCSSMAVELEQGVVVIEASNSPANGDTILDQIEQLYPGRPITHVLATHHHQDHAAGVRSVVAAGAELVVGNGVLDLWTEILAAPSSVRPDSLAAAADVEPEITELALGGSWTVEDADIRVSAHHLPQNPHAADMLIVEIETGGQRFVYEGDLYNAGNGFTVVIGGQPPLFERMRELGIIDGACAPALPTTIVPAHGVPQSIEASVAELDMLGVEIGCL